MASAKMRRTSASSVGDDAAPAGEGPTGRSPNPSLSHSRVKAAVAATLLTAFPDAAGLAPPNEGARDTMTTLAASSLAAYRGVEEMDSVAFCGQVGFAA